MKKLLSTILFAFMAAAMLAQSDGSYRLVVHHKNGVTQSFAVSDVDSISFVKADSAGVYVDVTEINSGAEDASVVLTIIPDEACAKYRFSVVPQAIADAYGADVQNMKSYFDSDASLPAYTEPLKNAVVSGLPFNLLPGVTYAVMVLSYDKQDVACGAQVFLFTVPAVPLIGSPSVACHVDSTSFTSVTVTLTPNADCAGYYACFFTKGLAEQQYEQMAPMMGFVCMGEMIKSFGQMLHKDAFTQTWDKLTAGNEYEVYIQPIDANGNYAPMIVAAVQTKAAGGEGVAVMDIELGALKWNEEKKSYFKEITFIPNDQTAAHRDIVVAKSAFDNGTWTEETLADYMKHDKNPDYPPFVDDPEWDKFGMHKGDFQVNAGETYYVYSIGKNLKGEYGQIVKKEFTVNAEAPKNAAKNHASFAREHGVSRDVTIGGGRTFRLMKVEK